MNKVFRYLLKPESAFGTPLVGDTLFGQVCWALREGWGEVRLGELLEGYLEGSPFLVLSDAFPHGHLPRPQVPGRFVFRPGEEHDPSRRKELKKKAWLPLASVPKTSHQWLSEAVALDWRIGVERSHNSLDRLTGTTGTGDGFAPFAQHILQHGDGGTILDLYVVLDEPRLPSEWLSQILSDIGNFGYGRNATTGEGRFSISGCDEITGKGPVANIKAKQACMALANVAPQGMAWDSSRCWYTPLTRFGRHGSQGALSGKPFKNPVLLAATGAILTPDQDTTIPFLGQGIGGRNRLSKAIFGTVHQGYAPVVPLSLQEGA